MSLRRIVFWSHLCVGLVIAVVVAFLAVTGAILSFAPQWIELAERNARVQPHPGDACVAPSALLSAAAHAAVAAGNEPVSGLTLFADRIRPAQVALGSRGAVLLADGCSGQILGPGANRLRVFLVAVMEVHHMMSTRGPRHQNLRAVKNAAVVGFGGMILSGLVLWWPHSLTPQRLRNALLLRGGLRGRSRDWNLHNVAGFWLSLPLLVIVGTGLIMAYPWANGLLFRAAGEQPPARRAPDPAGRRQVESDRRPERAARPAEAARRAGSAGTPAKLETPPSVDEAMLAAANAPPSAAPFATLDRPFATALSYAPGVQSVTLNRLPAPGTEVASVQFQLGRGQGPEFIHRDQLTVRVPDGQVLRFESPQTASRGRHWRFIARFLHTGQIFGVAGQATALLSALAALLLVWTGVSLALRRFAAWRRSQARRTPQQNPVHAAGD